MKKGGKRERQRLSRWSRRDEVERKKGEENEGDKGKEESGDVAAALEEKKPRV